ncbi:glycoside hydrolase family 5 protein [Mucilaginibacter sp. PPCGB 2223]|uniref:glycoside hydrolase family 5 protein n=1 Tax=Mucilaginibacter sp. PPCGB 2223 TaxID=1886027 RepID=UPI001586751A|nr:cellulase family glycosylhydrolase [Mucilaginibacter sp. PPCGB 2223]
MYNDDREWLFKRAARLNNGINISWLEQTWSRKIVSDTFVQRSDFVLLKKLGFRAVRLPVAFTYFNDKQIELTEVFKRIDLVLKLCKEYGFSLIVDYHNGNLKNDNYLTETPKIIDTWQKVAKYYIKESPDRLFFDIYNEPVVTDQVWKDAAYNIVTGIRKVDTKRTLLVGASNYNSIYELSRFERLADDNIIYAFHFYEPFFFTHQGAEWIGNESATTGVAFPYSEENFPRLNPKAKNTWGETKYYEYRNDGNEQSLMDKLSKYVKPWSDKYRVPVVCSEYGAYNKYADLDSRCRYIKAMRKTLAALSIPGMMWEYNDGFSIFNGRPSLQNLPGCMQDAIGYHN